MRPITYIIIAIVVVIALFFVVMSNRTVAPTITSFDECAAAGNPIMESYPEQCQANGQTFVRDIGNELEKSDLIRISNPRPNQIMSDTITIKGEARGYWFFEASFPFEIRDGNNEIIYQSYAEATEDWMTEDFVPFARSFSFDPPETDVGTLILRRDNPSDLPENDDQLIVPVRFR